MDCQIVTNSNETIEKHKIAASMKRWTDCKDIIFLITKLGTVVWCIHIIMTNLVLMADKNPEAISSIATVVQSLSISNIVLYIVAATSVGYGYFERKGKKRAIEKMASYQYQLEKLDPHRGTSALTSQGDTPKPSKKKRGTR